MRLLRITIIFSLFLFFLSSENFVKKVSAQQTCDLSSEDIVMRGSTQTCNPCRQAVEAMGQKMCCCQKGGPQPTQPLVPGQPTTAAPVTEPTVAIESNTSDIHGGSACPDKIFTALGCAPMNLNGILTWVFNRVLGIAGGIAFLLSVFGGVKILTSSGDPKGIQSGQEMISSAITGLIFIIFSIFLLQLIGVNILSIPGL